MNRVICNAINKVLQYKNMNDISKKDIWNNCSDTIYKYYSNEDTFDKNFSLNELSGLHVYVCSRCNRVFARMCYSTDILCQECINSDTMSATPSCMPKDSKEYQDWYNANLAAMPNCKDMNSKEYQEWYTNYMNNNPSSMPKDSKEYQNWYDDHPMSKPESSVEYQDWYNSIIRNNPACKDTNSKEYQNWYKSITNSMPQCKDVNSKEYQNWHKTFIESNPANKEAGSIEYQNWYNRYKNAVMSSKWYENVIKNNPACKDTNSKEYQDWYNANLQAAPAHRDINSKEYQDWHNAVVSSMPQCMNENSKEYQEWYSNSIKGNPACNKYTKEYQEWYKAWANGNANKKWHKYTADELRLMNFNLKYVKRNEIGQEYLNYQYDDKVGKFYPDFKIQIGYGTTTNADWEWIEYKGDHLLEGLWDDQSHNLDKYRDCHDKVGFVPTSLSWLFELCIMNPSANTLWCNPRILAYVIYDIWNNKINIDWSADMDSIFEIIHNEYNKLSEVKINGC